MKFPDVHTHSELELQRPATIFNRYSGFGSLPPTGLFSTGLHPWYLNAETLDQEFESLRFACQHSNVVAIGECGLDRACTTPYSLQKHAFELQIALANDVKKPLIIHCVRAYDDVLHSLQKNNCSVPVMFHGFNKGWGIAQLILQQGHYLSFGKHLCTNDTAKEVFRQTPIERIFLETDDSGLPIESIYTAAAVLKQVDLTLLCKRIQENAELFFGHQFE